MTATGQGQPADTQPHDDESLNTFMVSCRDEVLAPRYTPSRLARHREPINLTRDPPKSAASASCQAHLRRNYATPGPMASGHAASANDGCADGNPTETTSQRPHILPQLSAQGHGTILPGDNAAAGTPAGQQPREQSNPGDRKT